MVPKTPISAGVCGALTLVSDGLLKFQQELVVLMRNSDGAVQVPRGCWGDGLLISGF